MKDSLFETGTYSVVAAVNRDVGNEWNFVKWDINHPQIQYHRLYLLTEGSATLRLFDRELTLLPGQVYFVPAFSVKESRIEGKMNKYYIHFQSTSSFFSLYRYLSDKYYAPATKETEYLFKTVVDSYKDDSISARFRLQGAMNLILSDFVADVTASVPDLVKFDEVLRFIDENYRKNIMLSELSSIMNISTMYFSNYFKRVFRISPKQYILNKRLTESQRLLLESRMSIKEIAYEVGFENENYFSEFFTSKVGVSALKFRKRIIPAEEEV
jgi:AraC-like DNA-binding protein